MAERRLTCDRSTTHGCASAPRPDAGSLPDRLTGPARGAHSDLRRCAMHAATPDPRTARDWSPFALLLIDAQHDFWPEPMAARLPLFPANVARLLARCRTEGIDVVHLRSEFLADMSDWMVVHKLRGSTPCIAGTPGSDPLPFALGEAGEKVIVKQSFDGF